jgi:arsenate reductase
MTSAATLTALSAMQPKLPVKLLFICTHNRCRSILAEAIATEVGGDLLQAASAGSEPAGEIHPTTLLSLERHGIPAKGLRSKGLRDVDEFDPDFVISVCDRSGACPAWIGRTRPFHWGLDDPTALDSGAPEQEAAFDNAIATLTARLRWLRAGVEQGLNHQGLVMLISALADTRPQATLQR